MMNKEAVKKWMVVSMFWGALWGFSEATLGYLAHLVLLIPGIAGFIMFPIGFYFMTRAYRETGKLGSLFSTAAVAASIKLVDLFLPGLSPIKTINPALCILMESLVVMALFKAVNFDLQKIRFKEALAAGLGWRLAFMAYSGLLFALSISGEFFQGGIVSIIRFLLLGSVINAVLISAYLQAEKSFSLGKRHAFFVTRPAVSIAALAAAVLVKIVLAA
jgi:hypothetical protein